MDAFVKSILVVVMGTVALRILSSVFHEMLPSLPPGLKSHPALEAESSPTWQFLVTWLMEHRLAIVFAIIFVLMSSLRLVSYFRGDIPSGTPTRIRRIAGRVSEEWFGLVVGNAFGAMITALVLVWVQRFSWSQMLWHWLLEPVFAILQNAANHLLGSDRGEALARLMAWYGENQMRFTFWFLYFAAIADDLGLPNFKALGRWAWRRLIRARHKTAFQPEA